LQFKYCLLCLWRLKIKSFNMNDALTRLTELNDELFANGDAFHKNGEIMYNSCIREIKNQLVNEFKTIVNSLPICIHELDKSGKIIMMNPAGLDMLQLSNENQVIGKQYLDYIHDTDKDRIYQLFENATRGVSSTFTFKSTDNKYFNSCFIPVLKGKSVEKIIGYSSDITKHK